MSFQRKSSEISFCLLVAAGNDTTRYSIAAGMQAMCHQPELLEQMQTNPKVWETAADEIIRWATPALYFRRTLTHDYDAHRQNHESWRQSVILVCHPPTVMSAHLTIRFV